MLRATICKVFAPGFGPRYHAGQVATASTIAPASFRTACVWTTTCVGPPNEPRLPPPPVISQRTLWPGAGVRLGWMVVIRDCGPGTDVLTMAVCWYSPT